MKVMIVMMQIFFLDALDILDSQAKFQSSGLPFFRQDALSLDSGLGCRQEESSVD